MRRRLALVHIKGLPVDAAIWELDWDVIKQEHILIVQSKSFPIVEEGQPIPEMSDNAAS